MSKSPSFPEAKDSMCIANCFLFRETYEYFINQERLTEKVIEESLDIDIIFQVCTIL